MKQRHDLSMYALKFSILAQALSLIGFETGADEFGIVPTPGHASLLAYQRHPGDFERNCGSVLPGGSKALNPTTFCSKPMPNRIVT